MGKDKELTSEEVLRAEVPTKKGGRTQLISGAVYHEFDKDPIFIGTYQREHYSADGNLIGYDFVNQDGEEVIISNSVAITKALDIEVNGAMVRDLGKPIEITFMGQVTIKSSGKPYNRFSIVLLG
jgi:hypothetical protein